MSRSIRMSDEGYKKVSQIKVSKKRDKRFWSITYIIDQAINLLANEMKGGKKGEREE